MSNYVKKFERGEMYLDLPYANCIYELPLLSFADMRHSLNLSLIFNQTMKEVGENPFHIANGFKLNLQKRIIFKTDGTQFFQEVNGKCVALHAQIGSDYTFEDDSQRIIRTEFRQNLPTIYTLENVDGSCEKYEAYDEQHQNGAKTRIVAVIDKYGEKVLSYAYNESGQLSSVIYREESVIPMRKELVFAYGSNAQLNQIDLKSNNAVVASIIFTYQDNGDLKIAHYSGVDYTLSANGRNFEVVVEGTENNTSVSYARKCTKVDDYTLEFSNLEGNEEINKTTYVFSNLVESSQTVSRYVEITDNLGVKNRKQFQFTELTSGELCLPRMTYSYEINEDSQPFFAEKTVDGKEKVYCAGKVDVYSTEDGLRASQIAYVQDIHMGSNLQYEGTPISCTVSKDTQGGKGYFILSGWIRPANESTSKVNVYCNTAEENEIFKTSNLVPNKWMYFAFKIFTDSNSIEIDFSSESAIQLADLRLAYQQTHTQAKGTYTSILSQDVLISKETGTIVPMEDIQDWRFGNNSTVYFSDLFKFKINQKREQHITEFYSAHCRYISTVSGTVEFTYGGRDDNKLEDYYIGKYQKIDGVEVITKVKDDVEGCFMVSETIMDGKTIRCEKIDCNLDTFESTSNDVTTTYTRDRGLITSETTEDATVSTIYQETEGEILFIDRFGHQKVHVIDTTWGGVKRTELPDGSLVTDIYDDDQCVLVRKDFSDGTSTVSHAYSYSAGRPSSLSLPGGIEYAFTYCKGELESVIKNDSVIEQYTHSTIIEDEKKVGYAITTSKPLYSITKKYDIYGRLTTVDDSLTFSYEVDPHFDTNGELSVKANNATSKLAMTVDSKAGETSRYYYTYRDQLSKKTVTDKDDCANVKIEESFVYDQNDGHLTEHTHRNFILSKIISESFTSHSKENRQCETKTIEYEYGDVKNNVTISNTYDQEKKMCFEASFIVEQSRFDKKFIYDKNRMVRITETFSKNEGETSSNNWVLKTSSENVYTFDAFGRIQSEARLLSSSPYRLEDFKSYEYDHLGRLVRENNRLLDKTIIYQYNENGDVASVKTYSFTTVATPLGSYEEQNFVYDSTSKDKLVSFDGGAVAYNANDEMTSFDGWSYTWSKGKLTMLHKSLDSTSWALKPNLPSISSSKTYSFTYNAFGQRTMVQYSYFISSDALTPVEDGEPISYTKKFYYDYAGKLVMETSTKTLYGGGSEHYEIAYVYDGNTIVGMEYTQGEQRNLYYFQRDLQGDVVAIYDTEGNLKVRYLYDAWGKCIVGNETTDLVLAKINPIRYRGYYYDVDTKLYHLNARYYSPELCRFIQPANVSESNSANSGLDLFNCNNGFYHISKCEVTHVNSGDSDVMNETMKPLAPTLPTAHSVKDILSSIISKINLSWECEDYTPSQPQFMVFSNKKMAIVDWSLQYKKISFYFNQSKDFSLYGNVGTVNLFAGYNVEKRKAGLFAEANIFTVGYDGKYIDLGYSPAGIGFIYGWEDGKFRFKIDFPGTPGLEISIDFAKLISDLFGKFIK